ncbi:hypothetical protein [Bacillus sp. ISL-7]|uniref:hypothetical protein n=1 Tax=Bacillus sp. ISL-7 TaxID=2819136 RepID=UPI001BEA2B70|nr:hypothetical protein [Bacillus sp. ISL-7]MBT2736160.1 hypothetical protein [Bacillus sp. ISL-7]
MKVKALISIIGKYSLNAGDVAVIVDKNILKDLLKHGYVVEVKNKQKVKTDGN